MNVEGPTQRGRRILAAGPTHWLLVGVYATAVLIILAPVLFASIGGDDTYWILEQPVLNHGSLWHAFWSPLAHAFDFAGERTTPLAISERRVIAVLTMSIATTFSIPPLAVWVLLKLSLLAAMFGAVVLFLRLLTFRDREGAVRHLTSSSVTFIMIALPITVAMGIKAQNVGTLNGWNFYPSLTYGPFLAFLLLPALALKLSVLLDRNYRAWILPTVTLGVTIALAINLEYELYFLAIPITALLLLLQPNPERASTWLRWRAKLTVMAAFVVTFTMIFVWMRWQISQMACHATNTCYAGEQIQLKPRTLLYNFVGALPTGTSSFVADQARQAHRPFPDVNSFSVAVAVIGVVAMVGLWLSWSARHQRLDAENHADSTSAGGDSRGLVIVILVGFLVAVGSASITAITARAVELVVTPVVPYRTGVLTWSAVAFCAVATVRLMMSTRWRVLSQGALILLSAAVVTVVALFLPRNIMSAQVNRVTATTPFYDSIHREVALGDKSVTGDARRCASISAALGGQAIPTGGVTKQTGFSRTLNGAYASFEYYYSQPYCSSRVGLTN